MVQVGLCLFFIPRCFLTGRGEDAGLFGVSGGIRLKHIFVLSSALFLWCQKGVGALSNHLFSALSCNSTAMLCLSLLVSMEGQRGSVSEPQFCLSNMTVCDKMLLFLVKLESFCKKLAEVCPCSVILLYKSNLCCCREWCINGLFPWCWALNSLWS